MVVGMPVWTCPEDMLRRVALVRRGRESSCVVRFFIEDSEKGVFVVANACELLWRLQIRGVELASLFCTPAVFIDGAPRRDTSAGCSLVVHGL